ncbi:MAG: hypothetical protein WCI55_07135 [Armatimonadota bacterium]
MTKFLDKHMILIVMKKFRRINGIATVIVPWTVCISSMAIAQSEGDTRNVSPTTHRASVTTTEVTVKPPGTHTYEYDLHLNDTCTGNSHNHTSWTSPFQTLKNVESIHFQRSGTLTVPSGKIGKLILSKTHTAYGSTGGNENVDAQELLGGEVFSGTSWVAFVWTRNERSYTDCTLTTVIEDLPGNSGGG